MKGLTINQNGTAVLLAFTSGYVDTLTFVALFGLFSAHITGNFVLIASSIVEFRLGLWMKLLAVPVFVMAAVGTRMFIIRRERHSREAAAHVLFAQAALLFLFMMAGTQYAPFPHHNSPSAILTGLLAVAAMAIQNTAARTFFSDMPPTTVMTGNLIQVIVDIVDIAHAHTGVEAKRARLARLAPMLLAFIVGTLGGALAYVWVGYWAAAVPIVVIGAASLTIRPMVKSPA